MHCINDRLYLTSSSGCLSTLNDGLEWTFHSENGLFSNSFESGDTILFLGIGGLLSIDDGLTWQYINADASNPLSGEYEFVKTENIIFGYSNSYNNLFYSTDWGMTWNFHYFPYQEKDSKLR
ncbi:MAG: hypothetical protein IPM82_24490 [Saprospiraceae bacterium]|nr:hypothetical protein [Saprospiraceae bacterium]